MADRDLEQRSHAYWQALAAQPAQRNAAESLSQDQARSMVTTRRNVKPTEDDSHGEVEQPRRRRALSP